MSLSGSFQLSIDMSSYRKLFYEFDDDHLIKEFSVLEVLTNLFKVFWWFMIQKGLKASAKKIYRGRAIVQDSIPGSYIKLYF